MADFLTLISLRFNSLRTDTAYILRETMKNIALAALLFATPAAAGDFDEVDFSVNNFVVETFTAYISVNDLTTSSGARLGDAASIIRQDRANFHRFGLGDASDETDPLFADSDARARIPELINAAGGIHSDVADWIMRGNVQVYINIMSDGDNFTGLEVHMAG
jgi:hypothetical protein